MIKTISIIALILFSTIEAKKTDIDSLINVGINQIYSLRFNSANSTFADLKKIQPENPKPYFFDAMVLWWEILIDIKNQKNDKRFYEKLDIVIEKCENILDKESNNFEALFFKMGALGFSGQLKSVREEWLSAALDGKAALPIVMELNKLYPNNYDIYLGLGIYNYYADVIPKNYPVLKPFTSLFPKGNKEQGLLQLEKAGKKGKNTAIEADYFLANVELVFELNYEKSAKISKKLAKRFPQNPIFENILARSYFGLKKNEKADSIFQLILKKSESQKLGYGIQLKGSTLYYLGDIQFRNGNLPKAKEFFKESVQIFQQLNLEENFGFIVNGKMYLAKIAKQEKNYGLAVKYYRSVLDLDDYDNSHKRAEREIFLIESRK